MTFRVGQKVVLIHDGFRRKGVNNPVRGAVYTVRALYETPGGTGIHLNEIRNSPQKWLDCEGEPGWFAWRFRPVVERGTKTGMAILRRLLKTKQREDA